MSNILQITPHPIFPPRGGRRAFFYQRELSRRHDVTVLVPQGKHEMTGVREGYRMPDDVCILSTSDTPAPRSIFPWLPQRVSNALQHRWVRRSLTGPAANELLSSWHLLEHALQTQSFDIVIFDHIQTLCMAAIVQRISPRAVRMLNAHNVDHVLYSRLAESAGSKKERSMYLAAREGSKRIERNLAAYVHGYWACSDNDLQELRKLNGSDLLGYSIPNGIAPEVLQFDDRPEKRTFRQVLFCGSLNYAPNRRGLEWFGERVWPRIKGQLTGVRFVVIGYGAADSDFRGLRKDPSVDFVGEVSEVHPWYHRTSVSVAPIFEGSGTRVKILEAMALGNPVISTTLGCEGIEITNGREILLADDPDSFARQVLVCLENAEIYATLQRRGRELIEEKYDWRVIGRALNDTIDDILQKVRH